MISAVSAPPCARASTPPPRAATARRPRAAPRPWKLLVLALPRRSRRCRCSARRAPTYDPWAWIIWGREIAELDLDTTSGPSWKPLPVLFTTPFALARRRRRARPVAARRARRRAARDRDGLPARLAARRAGRPGVIAGGSLLLADEFVRNFARGNSEGLLVALVPVGGRAPPRRPPRATRSCSASRAALLRPEVWPFFGAVRAVAARGASRAGALLVLGASRVNGVLWFVPEYWGSGDFLRAANRAHQPNPDSAAFADLPVPRGRSAARAPILSRAGAASARSSRSCVAVRERRPRPVALGRRAAVLMVAVAADDRRAASRATCATSRCRPRSCACSPASAGSSSCARCARAGRARGGRAGRRARRRRARRSCRRPRRAARRRARARAEARSTARCRAAIAKAGGARRDQALRPRLHRHRSRSRPSRGSCTCTAATSGSSRRRPAPSIAARVHARSRATSASRAITAEPAAGSCGATCDALSDRSILTAAWRPSLAPGVGAAGAGARARAARRPAGLGAARRTPLLLRTDELGVGYWVDEGLSVGIADRPLADIPGVLRQDGSPPLYYMLLHVWMALAGSGEAATHALSLLFALLAIPVAFWARPALFGRRAAWIAAVLTALNPFLTQYAQETRMYALVVLLGCSRRRCSCRLRAARAPARRWPVRSRLALAALLYTHNWALFFGAAGRRVARRCSCAGAAAERRRAAARRRCSASAARAALPAVGADAAVPGRAHRRAVVATARRRGSLLGGARPAARPHGAVRAAGRRPAAASSRWCAPAAAAADGRRPRRAALVGIVAVGTLLLACGASQLSPAWAMRYLAVARPAAAAARARPGSPPRGRLGLVGARARRDAVGLRRRRRRRRATCARSRRRSRPASRPATSSSRPSPSRCPCCTTTCREGCATRR